MSITKKQYELMNQFYNLLQDDESKDLFIARYNFFLNGRVNDFMQEIPLNKKFESKELSEFFANRDKNKCLIYGACVYGKILKKVLEDIGVRVTAYVDRDADKQITGWNDLPVVDPQVLKREYGDYNIIMSARLKLGEIYGGLMRQRFPAEQILWPKDGITFGIMGKQYFDLQTLPHVEDEVFIDGGSLNMESSAEFAKWCNNDYSKIYVFEPDTYSYNVCSDKMKDFPEGKVELINKATWNEDAELCFSGGLNGGSRVNKNSANIVQATSIDNVIRDGRCTFIKLDVEGAELETLKGAVKTIQNNHPKLAISIYHKRDDIVEIPTFLMENFRGYKYYIRHYSSVWWETVLYGIYDPEWSKMG